MQWLVSYPENGPSVSFYEAFVRAAGAEPVLLDAQFTQRDDAGDCAALVLSGGGDVAPARYGEGVVHPNTYDVDPRRDEQELALIDEFLRKGRPIFGICRGIQILNVAFGGGLLQHVPDLIPESVERHRKQDAYDAMHALVANPSTRLGAALTDVRETNSAHHQALDQDRIGRGLRVAARSGAGLVEAVESVDAARRISAVQWHPERLPLEHSASAALRAHWRALALSA